ncbi:Hypothetical_protein [Hexamita inflata]|uniref:Hypothetical_protein n=1 Tax=Hexamita inflata TaxID=28002 RepID=A0AA86N7P4_9EUKA|nr:Hypothetical protein HINF_LOCUS2169 [Hexamita inflata]
MIGTSSAKVIVTNANINYNVIGYAHISNFGFIGCLTNDSSFNSFNNVIIKFQMILKEQYNNNEMNVASLVGQCQSIHLQISSVTLLQNNISSSYNSALLCAFTQFSHIDIKDIIIQNSEINSISNIYAIAGGVLGQCYHNSVVLKNIKLILSTIQAKSSSESQQSYVGGIIGNLVKSSIKSNNCQIYETNIYLSSQQGAVAGFLAGITQNINCVIENIKMKANNITELSQIARTAGIIAIIQDGTLYLQNIIIQKSNIQSLCNSIIYQITYNWWTIIGGVLSISSQCNMSINNIQLEDTKLQLIGNQQQDQTTAIAGLVAYVLKSNSVNISNVIITQLNLQSNSIVSYNSGGIGYLTGQDEYDQSNPITIQTVISNISIINTYSQLFSQKQVTYGGLIASQYYVNSVVQNILVECSAINSQSNSNIVQGGILGCSVSTTSKLYKINVLSLQFDAVGLNSIVSSCLISNMAETNLLISSSKINECSVQSNTTNPIYSYGNNIIGGIVGHVQQCNITITNIQLNIAYFDSNADQQQLFTSSIIGALNTQQYYSQIQISHLKIDSLNIKEQGNLNNTLGYESKTTFVMNIAYPNPTNINISIQNSQSVGFSYINEVLITNCISLLNLTENGQLPNYGC